MRLIYEEDVKKEIDEWLDAVGEAFVRKGVSYYGELMGCIEDAPTVEAKEVVHGEWIDMRESSKDVPQCKCSVCGKEMIGLETNFCPNCGSKMKG